MTSLVDVNVLVACGWSSHVEHRRTSRWLSRTRDFATCSVTQMGFMRVSLSPAYRASFQDALLALGDIVALRGHRFVGDATAAVDLPVVHGTKEVTDAHLVQLARAHGLELATLDEALCGKPWARGTAVLVR